ncbi:RidA family protein [Kiloniella sp. b19]|uniref:RidA family protein n=1 Tax=Kiloniella sp. GXU_MW_B19 TaxID=3141326 RepID=UPI0031D508F2
MNEDVKTMKRTAVNPWPWSLNYGYNQAEIIDRSARCLVCSGQTSVDGEGNPQHAGDMRNQIALSLDNLETVLNAAEMTFSNVIRLSLYTTDVDDAMKHLDLLGSRFGRFGVTPPMTLLGVTRLALPPLMFEIEATAAD